MTVDGQRRKVHGVKVTTVGVSILKARLYAHLRQEMPADGKAAPYGLCHFPGYDDEFFKMLTAEQVVTRSNRGGYAVAEWVKVRPRNEALDCRMYAMAAALALWASTVSPKPLGTPVSRLPGFRYKTPRHPDDQTPSTPPETGPCGGSGGTTPPRPPAGIQIEVDVGRVTPAARTATAA